LFLWSHSLIFAERLEERLGLLKAQIVELKPTTSGRERRALETVAGYLMQQLFELQCS
jgi:hypothetical protein